MSKLEEMIRPRRVLCGDSSALPPRMAQSRYQVVPDIVFIRDDNWTLGANEENEHHAYALWKDQWSHYQRQGEPIKPISQYEPR